MGALDAAIDKNFKTERKSKAVNGGGNNSPTTQNGYDVGEVVSALQKAIRRNNEKQALYWADELMASDQGYRMWRRLIVIAAEDVGLADPNMVARIMLMKQAHDMGREANIPFLAVMLLCRADKNREADDAAYMYELRRKKGWKIKMPPEAQDGHTRSGRSRLYRIAEKTGEHWEKVWCREFYYDAALLRNYVEIDGDVYRQQLMKDLDLPFQTYDLETCPEPRILTGDARGQSDRETEAEIASRIPDKPEITKLVDPETGEVMRDRYVVDSFTESGTRYEVDVAEQTCTCPAFTKGPANSVCKHLMAVYQEVHK